MQDHALYRSRPRRGSSGCFSPFWLVFCLLFPAWTAMADEAEPEQSGTPDEQTDTQEDDEAENGSGLIRNGLLNGQVRRVMEELETDLQEAWGWLGERRDDVSRNVATTGENIDDWLAGDVVGERANQSYLRIRLNQRIGRHNTYHSNARIGGRLDLPRASERWSLIFESESEERSTLREQRVDNIYPSSFRGGFRYELDERGGWSFSHDIGARARIPPDVFYRFRSRYSTVLGEHWDSSLRHRVYYYHEDGWGQDMRLAVGRDIGDSFYLRVGTDLNYQHTSLRELEFSQNVSLNQDLGEFETISYEVGLLGTNRPHTKVEDYYAQMVYRKAIYEDWLIMELVPQMLFEKEKSWSPDPRVQFNLEVYFFDF